MVELGDRSSISVGELRARILRGQSSQQGFDLVFSDEDSGLVYEGDGSQIPTGSCVIVRRVPCGMRPSVMPPILVVTNTARKDSHNPSPLKELEREFDYLAALCSVPNFPDFSLESDYKMDDIADLSFEFQENGSIYYNTSLPLELKCPLCKTFFKEAVMIPCCQHSFCEKCVGDELIENGRCPKCFSDKCNVGDLLPNLSLRRAIVHFVEESEVFARELENEMRKYVPDGESGIQVDVSCVTGKGSNRVYEQEHQRNAPYMNSGNRDIAPLEEFQDENQPVFTEVNEADSNTKAKGGFRIDSGGKQYCLKNQGIHNCYTCGSPDHLIRDCPISNPNPMFQSGNGVFHGGMPGYAPLYWNGSPLPPLFRLYANMYSNPAMMPFNASMVPASPYTLSPYVRFVCGALPVPGGNMGIGNMGPPIPSNHFGLERCENTRKLSNENIRKEQLSETEGDSPECHGINGPEKPHDFKLQKDKKPSKSLSDDSRAQRMERKIQHYKHMCSDVQKLSAGRGETSSRPSYAGRDKRLNHAERSNSGKEFLSGSSDRHKHHDVELKKHHERRGRSDGDSSLGAKKRVEADVRGSQKKHRGFPESGFESISPAGRSAGYKDRDAGHDSRYSKHSAKHTRDKQHADRWQMVDNSSDEDYKDDYRYYKRRVH